MSTTIIFKTDRHLPDTTITVRFEPEWDDDVRGVYNYVAAEWRFTVRRAVPFEFKFVRNFAEWQNGANLIAGRSSNEYYDANVAFGNPRLPDPESSVVSNTFFRPNLSPDTRYDVIVVGSGVGGGILAEQLVDENKNQRVLVLELGSYLFPSHVSNLPRRHRFGPQVYKHVWELFSGRFRSTPYDNVAGSQYNGGFGYNLGGRSIFWGGFAPTMREYEFEKGAWPDVVRDEMLNTYFERSRELMKVGKPRDSVFQERAKAYIANLLGDTDFDAVDADMAVQRQTSDLRTFSAGMFSTADHLFEQRATDIANKGQSNLTVNLNHDVRTVNIDRGQVSSITAYDRLSRETRTYFADKYVLCAGALESPRIALKSGVPDSSGKIGRGLTDHKIWFVHFLLDKAQDSVLFSAEASAKIVIQHKNPTTTRFGWNAILELGADWNQGRYVDPEVMQEHIQEKGGKNIMICELVFLTSSELIEENFMEAADTEDGRPVRVFMREARRADQMFEEINEIKNKILTSINAQPVRDNPNLDLRVAGIGGVAHEVGSLRMGDSRASSVVNSDLKFWDVNNLYACDLSVFPTSPSANPTLALGALALRLAKTLSS